MSGNGRRGRYTRPRREPAKLMELNSGLVLCYEPGAVGLVLSYFLWGPVALFACTVFMHLLVRDLFSLLNYYLSYSAVWLLAWVLSTLLAVPRPNADACGDLGWYTRNGSPDFWGVTTATYVFTWNAFAWLYAARILAEAVVAVDAVFAGYVAALVYNGYQSWPQLAFTLGLAAGVAALWVAFVYWVWAPMTFEDEARARFLREARATKGIAPRPRPGLFVDLILLKSPQSAAYYEAYRRRATPV